MNSLQVFTDALSDGNLNVQIKRKNQTNDNLEDATASDLNVLSTKTKIAETAHLLAQLSPEEKIVWASSTKEEANKYFTNGRYQEAMQLYVQCLAAADFSASRSNGDNQSNKSNNIDALVLPVVCNLAACSIQLKDWKKAASFCNQALALRPQCAKALYRRGIALLEIDEYDAALESWDTLNKLLSVDVVMPLSEQESLRIPGLIRQAKLGKQRQREHAKRQQLSLQKAFSSSPTKKSKNKESSVESTVELMSLREILSYIYFSILNFFANLLTGWKSPTKKMNSKQE